eukprot:TRINITY_DN40033_c0_g1_i2.p1 TRINITY_DN40033_c0_g1~~TRINITY_DN40033_c0_g1_i2.p1  ORF type:complete len:235 (-),score=12.45 TRINITY_DN40033_c0_g1_i2:239-943(-)
MASRARLQWIRSCVCAGRTATMHVSENVMLARSKLTVTLYPLESRTSSSSTVLVSSLDLFIDMCDSYCVTDRGHLHSSGVSRCVFFFQSVATRTTLVQVGSSSAAPEASGDGPPDLPMTEKITPALSQGRTAASATVVPDDVSQKRSGDAHAVRPAKHVRFEDSHLPTSQIPTLTSLTSKSSELDSLRLKFAGYQHNTELKMEVYEKQIRLMAQQVKELAEEQVSAGRPPHGHH